MVAQAVERLIELFRNFLPGKSGTAKANVALLAAAASLLAGIGASAGLGLYFLDAISVQEVPARIDILVSGLLIAGGTAGLHELIGRIEKAKKEAAAGAAASGAEAAATTAQAASDAGQAALQAAEAAKVVQGTGG